MPMQQLRTELAAELAARDPHADARLLRVVAVSCVLSSLCTYWWMTRQQTVTDDPLFQPL